MSKKSMSRMLPVAGALVMAAGLAFPALSGGHATVSPAQPQTSPVAASRTLYVLRVPNEKPQQPTYKVTVYVPTAVQEAISVRQTYDWKARLTRKDTGKKDDEGNPIYAITAVTWTAKKGAEIDPGFFGDFYFRFAEPGGRVAAVLPDPPVLRGGGEGEAEQARAQDEEARPRQPGDRQVDGSAQRGVPSLMREHRGIGQRRSVRERALRRALLAAVAVAGVALVAAPAALGHATVRPGELHGRRTSRSTRSRSRTSAR